MRTQRLCAVCAVLCLGLGAARADVVTDWNFKTAQFTLAARLLPPEANQVVATASVAVSDALTAIHQTSSPLLVKVEQAPEASADATVAAASRTILLKMVPAQQAGVEAAYEATLAKVPAGAAKESGIALGTRVAAAVLGARTIDGEVATESYRPFTTPGKYVPTTLPISLIASQRKLWLLASPDQFRPGPPPALESAIWARDYNEVKALGARTHSERSPEQTEIARFWEVTNPVIYVPLAQVVANMPGRDPGSNARLLAVVAMASDDALSAVFDAKFAYNFWRPLTAIRNGDTDGNDATERNASWLPLLDAPMFPEYPCAHCILSAAIGTVLKAALAGTVSPILTTSSPAVPGKPRQWASPDEFMREVGLARIYAGVHYRNSVEVGTIMGIRIGELAAARYLAKQ